MRITFDKPAVTLRAWNNIAYGQVVRHHNNGAPTHGTLGLYMKTRNASGVALANGEICDEAIMSNHDYSYELLDVELVVKS